MAAQDSRGLLIIVEGLDRSGKSSQCQRLHDYLTKAGRKVRSIKFPDRTTTTGQMINSYLTNKAQQEDHSIHLLFSANRWEAVAEIQKSISTGTTVIVDRYSFSGAVYSAAKDNPDLSLDWAWYPEIGLPQPDITFFLDLSSADAAKRGGYGEERYETEKMQARVRALYRVLFARLPRIGVNVIDAGKGIDEVAAEMQKLFEASAESLNLTNTTLKLPPLEAGSS